MHRIISFVHTQIQLVLFVCPKKFLSIPNHAVCGLQAVYNAQLKVLLTLVLGSDLLLFPDSNPENIQILDGKKCYR